MSMFKLEKGDKLSEIRERQFKREIELQKICEENLLKIFGLSFLKSQLVIHNFRIDTLAFDPEKKSFVIVEYKKDKNFSVVDQGYAYLSLILNNKADFILEYNENSQKNMKKNDVDWSQSKVIFVSPSFTNYQKESINFRDLPIELWEVKYYDNETLFFIQQKPRSATESIKTISKQSETIEKVAKEIKVYVEDDHLNSAPDYIKELYETFKQAILNIGENISINPTKMYIGFVVNKHSICDIHLLKKALKIWINLRTKELHDPKKISRDVSGIGHWGNGDYEIQVGDDENLEYIIGLIKQSYKKAIQ